MTAAPPLYASSLALLTDLYQLTMAHGYWKSGVADREAAFHLFFRHSPFDGGYAVACGLDAAIEHLERFAFAADDLAYLAGLRGNDGAPLFHPGFLDYLGAMRLSCDVDAMPEGTVAFPHEPLIRVIGPIAQCQLLETPLLNLVNFQTLIATKAARVCDAAGGAPVLEFGLRRAQGVDGALSASRAAHVGGCAATSNVLAGRRWGIPVKGTHAHSWVMFFADERAAFEAYARAMPNNCVFLVDTYDTIAGVHNAIAVARDLRARGHELAGIRLDSGDLAYLAEQARALLDAAGFPDAAIVASNDLDEHVIRSLREQGAPIALWGVGTKLATAYDQPALGGVYKLAAVRDADSRWRHAIKLSEQPIKISNPAVQQVRRYSQGGVMVGDLIYDADDGPTEGGPLHDLTDPTLAHPPPASDACADLLVPVIRAGRRVYDSPPLSEIRTYALDQLSRVDGRTRRFLNPQTYLVGLDRRIFERKQRLIARAREETATARSVTTPVAVSAPPGGGGPR